MANPRKTAKNLTAAAWMVWILTPFATGGTAEIPGRAPGAELHRDCTTCHALQVVDGHPIGVTAAPGALPLGPGGAIECQTCHDVDADHAAPPYDLDLRLPAARLCAACHARPARESSALFHALAIGRAHNGAEHGPQHARTSIDEDTRRCLTCHDGVTANAAMDADRAASFVHGPRHGSGRSYSQARQRSGLQLRPAHAILPPVRLADGRIGCGSCHSVYSPQPRLLHLPLAGGQLCLACHAM